MGNNAGSFRALLTVFMLGLFRPVKSHTSQLLYLGLFVVILVLGSHTLWVRYADQILQHDDYVLSADMIELTSVPPWIRTDIKRQAFDQGSLEGLSLAQPKLAVQVADAFALHPWVSQVKRVNPNYRRVVVDLEYREPVAMVWVTHMVEGQPQFGLYPVDGGGIFLPSADFYATSDSQDPGQASEHDPNNAEYLQIEVANDDNVWPAAAEGSSWGDERVHGAARLAALLLDVF